jgi:beta-glucosidase
MYHSLRKNYRLLSFLVFINVLNLSAHLSAQQAPYKNAKLPLQTRVNDLLKRMTIEEKAGQLNQLNGGVLTGPQAANDAGQQAKVKLLKEGKVGSLLNVLGAAETKAVQKIAVEQTRLGIPLIFGYDVIHGYKTIFPIPLAEACSWDLAGAEKTASIAANEASSAGLHWTFAPMMDVSREPRWGRVMEGSGEDPYLGSVFAAARVKGFQGNMDNHHIMACVKHFAAYGAPEAGREYGTVDMSRYALWNYYLPPYKAAVQAGAASVMNSFNVVDGVPASANKYLLTEVLKNRWSFKGFIVSDWASFGELIAHGHAEDGADAAQKALLAGSQMDMESSVVIQNLPKLVKEGKVPMAVVDQAVSKILEAKFKLGLFEDPFKYHDEAREKATLLSADNLKVAHEAACKSMVLMKNEGNVLPLSKNVKNVLVAGLFADSKEDALDFWCGQGDINDVVSYRKGITEKVSGATVQFAQGYTIDGKTTDALLAELKTKAAEAEVVVAVIGITGKIAGEARSLADINPSAGQMEMLRALKESGKTVIVVVHAGRPMILTEVQKQTPAIVYAWLSGTKQGSALADILFGDFNPSAKTVMTFPYAVGQIPVYYNAYNTNRPHRDGNEGGDGFWVSRYRDIPNAPLYPFGFGLSYSTFEYGNLTLSAPEMLKTGRVTASISVKNTSSKDGDEIVQLYVRDLVGTYVRPLKELKGFEKISLKAGETKTVSFTIDASKLSYFSEEGKTMLESGKFKIFVGGNSRDVKEADLRLK